MPVPSAITDLSTTAGSNSPGGGETPSEGDNHLRAAYSFIAQLRDKLNGADLTTATLGAVLVSSLVASGAISAATLSGTALSGGSLTTTGNTILGNAQADTLNVGAGDIIKDASGNTGFGVTPTDKVDIFGTAMKMRDGTYAVAMGKGSAVIAGGATSDFGISASTGAIRFGVQFASFAMLGDGRLYGNSLHNNSNPLTGTTNQYVGSGTYTPTLTNVSNATSITAYACQWKRVGNVVSVSGNLDCGATAGATLTVVRISLPIASNLANSNECRGTGAHIAATSILAASVDGDTTNDAALIRFIPPATGTVGTSFIFQYVVL